MTRPTVARVLSLRLELEQSLVVRSIHQDMGPKLIFCHGTFLQLDAENDRAISEHVLRGHRFRKPGSDMEPEQLNGTSAEGAGQQEQTESPEEAAQVTPRFICIQYPAQLALAAATSRYVAQHFHGLPFVFLSQYRR